jgi:hypothetical protein
MIFPNKVIFLSFRENCTPIDYKAGLYIGLGYMYIFFVLFCEGICQYSPYTCHSGIDIFPFSGLEEKESGFIKISGSSVVLYISEQKFHLKSENKTNWRSCVAELSHVLPMHCAENFKTNTK